MTEEKQWISIERLLLEHPIPLIAEAAQNHKIQTIDSVGRRILATNGDATDSKSKAFVLEKLADRFAMDQDPSPNDDFFYERLEIEGSPLDSFGWPNDQLPNFNEIEPHLQNPHAKKLWTQRPLKDFEEELKHAGSMEKAGETHNVTRQRYSQVINEKRKSNEWGKV